MILTKSFTTLVRRTATVSMLVVIFLLHSDLLRCCFRGFWKKPGATPVRCARPLQTRGGTRFVQRRHASAVLASLADVSQMSLRKRCIRFVLPKSRLLYL